MLKGGQYSVTGTATKITDALSLSGPVFCKAITVKNAKGAANLVYLGGASVTATPANAWAEIDANQSFTFYSGEGWLCSTDEVYVVGTATTANVTFIALVT